ncbi:MAG: copper chaperone PCu(A)C [Gammaproteobacteria bacterium]|nr:copper chaperone PCu(A)C [Gammaproteobacteria bacterium]
MFKYFFLAILWLPSLVIADSTLVSFSNGWIKQLPPVVPMRAGYMQIENTGEKEQTIIAIQSEQFERVEMHETKMSDGMMQMEELYNLVIPAKSSVELKPGGKHLMLITPTVSLEVGDTVDITVTFSDETAQRVQLKIKP